MKKVFRFLAAGLGAVLVFASVAGAQVVDTTTVVTTIYNIQNGSIPINKHVRVLNVVVTGVDIKPTTFGVYVQEVAGGAYSGILAFTNTVFPAYTNAMGTPAPGDQIIVDGVYDEFASFSEIVTKGGVTLRLTKVGTTAQIVPKKLPVDSLKLNYAGSERWEGVLVRCDSVKVTSIQAPFNNWRFHHFVGPVAGRVDSLVGWEKMVAGQVVPELGDQLNVVGVADFANGERRISPRGDNDITFLNGLPGPVPNLAYSTAENKIKVHFNTTLNTTDAQTTSNYSLSTFELITGAVYDGPTKTVTLTTGSNLVPSVTPHVLTVSGVRNSQNGPMNGPQTISFIGGVCTIDFVQTPKSAANDSSQVVNQQVTLRGVVTASTAGMNPDFPVSTGGFYMQRRGATQYGGIFVFGPPSVPNRGDSVLVSGSCTEFGVGPETEITGVDLIQVLGTGRPEIVPPVVTVHNACGVVPAEAEKYEAMLIKLSNVFSLDTGTFGSPFKVSTSLAGVDTVHVDDLAINESGYGPWRGDNDDVTGIIRFSGTAPFRRLQPRNWSEPPVGDIHVRAKANVSDAPAARLRTELMQNEPNPFNPTTRIDFTLDRAQPIAVRVYDVEGKRVRNLFVGVGKAGWNRLTWNGRDDRGRPVGSGLYLYRLFAGDIVQSKKMLLVK